MWREYELIEMSESTAEQENDAFEGVNVSANMLTELWSTKTMNLLFDVRNTQINTEPMFWTRFIAIPSRPHELDDAAITKRRDKAGTHPYFGKQAELIFQVSSPSLALHSRLVVCRLYSHSSENSDLAWWLVDLISICRRVLRLVRKWKCAQVVHKKGVGEGALLHVCSDGVVLLQNARISPL